MPPLVPPRSILPKTWDVPAELRERLGDSAGRQRAMFTDEHLLLILHKPPKANEALREGRFFWRNPKGEWKSSDLGNGEKALDAHLAEYTAIITHLDHQQDDAQHAAEYFEVLEATAPLHRAARNMQAALQSARQLCPHIHELINYRDHAYDIERTCELLYEDTKNALDFAIAKRAEEQAASSHQMAVAAHRWNLLAAFFFPMVTLASIFGTNLKHGLEERDSPYPFVVIMAVGLIAGTILQLFISRPAKPSPSTTRLPSRERGRG